MDYIYPNIERSEKEGARRENGVDKPKVGTEGREVDVGAWMGFLLFRRFSSLRKVMSDQC